MAATDPTPPADTRPLQPGAPVEDPTVARLVADVTRDVSSLFGQQLALFKSEVEQSAKRAGVAAALFAVAGTLALFALFFLGIAAAYLLHLTGLDLAWCFLIVFGAIVVLSVVLVLVAVRLLKKLTAPQKTIEQAKLNVGVLKRG